MKKFYNMPDDPELKALIMIYVWRENPMLPEEDGEKFLYLSEEVQEMLGSYVN